MYHRITSRINDKLGPVQYSRWLSLSVLILIYNDYILVTFWAKINKITLILLL